jgi:large subunit ribosomal protein L22
MNKINKNSQEATAIGRYIRMSPRKVGRVLNQIRGKSYIDAIMLLEFMPYKACKPIWQITNSAAANAEYRLNLKKENLIISEVFANQGPIFKRFRARAKGQGFGIRKPTCHIKVTVREKNKYY